MKVSPISNVYKNPLCFKKAQAVVCKKSDDAVNFNYAESEINHQLNTILEFDEKIEALKLQISKMRKIKPVPPEIKTLKLYAKNLIASKSSAVASFKRKTSILYDTTKPPRVIEQYLKEHPEIMPINQLKGAHNEDYDAIWRNRDFFVIDKTPYGVYLDASYEPNKENYRRITSRGVMTRQEVSNGYGIDGKTIREYLNDGIFHPLLLKNIITGEETPTLFLDMENDKVNSRAIERYRRFNAPVKPYPDESGLISVNMLTELGYGSSEKLVDLIEEGKLLGEVFFDNKTGSLKRKAKVFYNDFKTRTKLRNLKLRNPDNISIENLGKMVKMNVADIEDEILDERLHTIPYILYNGDKTDVLLNLKHPKNADFLTRKRFEQAVLLSKANTDSIMSAIIYELCPVTRKIGADIAKDNPEIKTILEKPTITESDKSDLKKIKTCSELLWQKAGSEEYKNALSVVKKACREYKTGGYKAVSDEKIRELLKNSVLKKRAENN